uniref:Uncharacterized protein n=1 Tax=Anguilla anguilla TaxID=7936 RepID=A0A0E9R7T1_ANGAN
MYLTSHKPGTHGNKSSTSSLKNRKVAPSGGRSIQK